MRTNGRTRDRLPLATNYREQGGVLQQVERTSDRLRDLELAERTLAGVPGEVTIRDAAGQPYGPASDVQIIAGANVTVSIRSIPGTKMVEVTIAATGGGGGATTFLALTDTPSTYVGQALKVVRVNAGETALEFAAPSGSGAGAIHYNYIVDPNYAGTNGDAYVLLTGQTVEIYKTIQLAVTAADAADAAKTIFINAGTYAEQVDLPITLVNDVTFIGEAHTVLWGSNTAGHKALTFSGLTGTGNFCFRNIRFRGGSHSVFGAQTNIKAFFVGCFFENSVSADFAGARFIDCWFNAGYDSDSGHSPATVQFTGCTFEGTSLWVGTVTSHTFVNCKWGGSTDKVQLNGSGSFDACFIGCDFSTSGAPKTFLDITDGAAKIQFDGCDFAPPGTNGAIWVESTADSFITIMVNGCRFDYAGAGTLPYIKFARAGRLIATGNRFDDNTGVDITGIFIDSVIGPNFPSDTNVQLDAGSSTVMYIGTGAITGTDALDAGVPLVQRAVGVPTHTMPEGSLYLDTTSNVLYVNNNSATSWTRVGGGAGAMVGRALEFALDTTAVHATNIVGFAPWRGQATPGVTCKAMMNSQGVISGTAQTFEIWINSTLVDTITIAIGLYEILGSASIVNVIDGDRFTVVHTGGGTGAVGVRYVCSIVEQV